MAARPGGWGEAVGREAQRVGIVPGIVMKGPDRDGDEAVGISHIKVRHVPSGKTRDFESADCVSFRDGKIAQFSQFVDTASVIEFMSKD